MSLKASFGAIWLRVNSLPDRSLQASQWQRMWPWESEGSSTCHSTAPQWQWPLKVWDIVTVVVLVVLWSEVEVTVWEVAVDGKAQDIYILAHTFTGVGAV